MNVARHADLIIGVVPIINLEWIQKLHRDRETRGYSTEAVVDTVLRRMPDYVNYICPQFSQTHINFQRVPTVDTSNPFTARYIPTADESFVVIRFNNPKGIDFQYLLSMIHDSFMSRPNIIVCPGGKMELAMQLILTPDDLEAHGCAPPRPGAAARARADRNRLGVAARRPAGATPGRGINYHCVTMRNPTLSATAALAPSENRLRGIMSMIAAVFVFAIMDSLLKRLSSHYGPLQVSFLRCFSSLVLLTCTIAFQRAWPQLRGGQPLLHLLRGALGVGMLGCFVFAVHRLTMAQTYSLFLAAPLLMTALSVPMHGEVVTGRRWCDHRRLAWAAC